MSRTDRVGDVVLVMPMAGILKQAFPGCKVSLLGTRYTLPLARCCRHLDDAYAWDEIEEMSQRDRLLLFRSWQADVFINILPNPIIATLAKQADIPRRIGTGRRLFHWLSCNRLVNLQRKDSSLHEAQLNLMLLKALCIKHSYSRTDIVDYYGLTKIPPLNPSIAAPIDHAKFNLIVHPTSLGKHGHWPVGYYAELMESLPQHRFNVLITGSEQERERVEHALPTHLPHVHSLMGNLALEQLVALIDRADGLLAGSTGPLHIAAALHKHALGIYSSQPSKRASRWGPIGAKSHIFDLAKDCYACRGTCDCACVRRIPPTQIKDYLLAIAGG